MSTDEQPTAIPDVDQLRQTEHDELPAVPVRQVEPVTVHALPSRVGPMFADDLTTAFAKILPADPKRKRATLLGSAAWEISRSGSVSSGVPWPASVALVIEHCDTVYARVPTSTGTLSVITEVWAD